MSEEKTKGKVLFEEGAINWRPALYVGGGVVTVWCFTLLSFAYGPELASLLGFKYPVFAVGERGTFGDMFGGVNALFSGLAFTGIIFTILLQRKEFELQREELKATRKVMDEQSETLSIQRFENTFFSMLSLHNEILASIDIIVRNERTLSGRDCINNHYENLKTRWPSFKKKNLNKEEQLSRCYEAWYGDKYTDMAHYFRMLYTIIKFVDQSDAINKKQYTNIVRAQLSAQEQALLFYNGVSKYGQGKFKELIEKYQLLENMPLNTLLEDEHTELYASEAFGDISNSTVALSGLRLFRKA